MKFFLKPESKKIDTASRLNVKQRFKESVSMLAVLLAVFLCISLISYDAADPSWSQTAWDGPIKNAAGSIGAWIADTLFFIFGSLAYLVPIALIVLGMAVYRRDRNRSINYFMLGGKIIGGILLLLTSCALADLNFDDFGHFSSGGVIGDVIVGLGLPILNPIGTTLVMMFFWAIGFTLLTGISWLLIIDFIGEKTYETLIKALNHVRGDKPQTIVPSIYDGELDEEEDPLFNHALGKPDVVYTKPDFSRPLNEPESPVSVPIYTAKHEEIEPDSDVLMLSSTEEAWNDEKLDQFIDEVWRETEAVEEKAAIEEDVEQDPFLVTVREAQAREAEKKNSVPMHPFLVRHEENLPKPTEPLPTIDLLEPPRNTATRASDEELQLLAKLIETRLDEYKIRVTVKGIYPGPVITRFELDLAPGVKVSRIMGLAKDIARSLSTSAVRVVDVISGKPYVGLELPNISRETVFMSEVVASDRFKSAKSPLSVVLGKDISGEAIVTDLAKSPHMLVAGTTGSGKSVGVNVMIVSMLYKASPEDVRFIMIDPKMLELSVYEGIPHLLSEVVTDMKDASNALRWCVAEMERRYKLMSKLGVRNIAGFNEKIKEAADANHPIPDPLWREGESMDSTAPNLEKLPYIVVIVDEFADLMMVVGKKVEELIARLAQKARAAGIHLVLATQRPSVDVITGLIKANIPTRMAFTVSTKTDSRTILDQGGAESLLGMGDMLFMPNGSNHPIRVHGAFVNDDEVHRVVNNWKARGKPQYITDITSGDQGNDGLLPGEAATGTDGDELDQLFDQVVEFVTDSRRASVSGVQRRFKIGYNRAARIVDQLEAQGIVSAPGHNSNREVLAPPPVRD